MDKETLKSLYEESTRKFETSKDPDFWAKVGDWLHGKIHRKKPKKKS